MYKNRALFRCSTYVIFEEGKALILDGVLVRRAGELWDAPERAEVELGMT